MLGQQNDSQTNLLLGFTDVSAPCRNKPIEVKLGEYIHLYCHVTEWLQTGFELMIGFTELFDTARDYALQFTVTHTLVSTVTCSLPLFGSGFNGGRFPFSGFLNCLCSQLPASHSNISQQLNRCSPLTNSITHQPTNLLTHWLPTLSTQSISARATEKTPLLIILVSFCCRGNMHVCGAVT
jgi:hypothetical protein